MKAGLSRAIISLAVVALAACSATGVAPTAQTMPAPVPLMAAIPAAASPCKIPKFWHFRGSCTPFTMHPHGANVTLATYRGLTLAERFFKNFAKPAGVVTAVGTSDDDITGKVGGVAFPVYGSVPCSDPFGHPSHCPGKAVLYNVFYNASDQGIGFGKTPRFSLKNAGSFPGDECELVTLEKTKTGKWAWVLQLLYATPKDGKIAFPSEGPVILDFPPGSAYVFGFICFPSSS
jgi:hypothetical protein